MREELSEEILREDANVAFHMVVQHQPRRDRRLVLPASPPASRLPMRHCGQLGRSHAEVIHKDRLLLGEVDGSRRSRSSELMAPHIEHSKLPLGCVAHANLLEGRRRATRHTILWQHKRERVVYSLYMLSTDPTLWRRYRPVMAEVIHTLQHRYIRLHSEFRPRLLRGLPHSRRVRE